MTNSAKTPSGKLSEQQVKDYAKGLSKDNVGVEARDNGKYRVNISRAYARMYYGKPEKRIGTGLSVLDAQGKIDKANADAIAAKVSQIHNDLANGYFDKTLVKYGLAEKPQLEAIDGGKKPRMSLLKLYDMYCESREGSMAETTLELKLKKEYKNTIIQAIETIGEDALAIYSWLIKNRSYSTVKECLRHLSKAYRLGIKHKDKTGCTENPFEDMEKKIKISRGNKKTQDNFDDEDGDEDNRAFSISERNAIITAFESSKRRQHLAPIIKFLFWTGCRTGEAIGLKWRDIKWDKELITIRRTYNQQLKLFKPTKTGTIRFFPMPKNGQLWNLLKSIPERETEDVVFTAKQGGIISRITMHKIWKGAKADNIPGVIPELIAQGKVSQYLKLYATRHTFVSIQKHIEKVPVETIAQWVGNGTMVSYNSYLERDKHTKPGESNNSTQSNTNNQSSQWDELLANLTSEQIEQLKAKLNG